MSEELRRLRHQKDIRTVMGTPEGRRVLWWLMEEVGGLFGKSYTGNAEVSVHLEGRRAVALEVMRETQALAAASFRLMMDEALLEEEEARLDANKTEPA